MKEFFIDTDIGFDEAQKFHGRVPTEDDYDLVVDADEVPVIVDANPICGRAC